jgi:outer membrane biosynthesis protein TonB
VLRLGVEAFRQDWWTDSLVQAFAISLAIHILLFGIVEVGHQLGWWKMTPISSLVRSMPRLKSASANLTPEQLRQQNRAAQEPPLLFVDVSPAQATPDPPKQAKYYSALNSKAANPNPTVDANVPRIDGKQTKIVQTADTPKVQPSTPQPPYLPLNPAKPDAGPNTASAERSLQPTLKPTTTPKPKPQELAKTITPATPGSKPGNTQMSAPESTPPAEAKAADATGARARPRTLAEARQRQGVLAGEKMKQEGGIKRFAVESSLDVRATPFGQYDAKFIAAVQKHWFDLLDEKDLVRGRSGKVVLRFNLYYDGRIANMQVAENDVGELLALVCQRAVLDPAPYGVWPSDLRRLAKSNFRDVKFTFYYN